MLKLPLYAPERDGSLKWFFMSKYYFKEASKIIVLRRKERDNKAF
jgi:hypothetical protein